MRYLALAVDYDGTAATDNELSGDVALALDRLRASGRRAILVTGRLVPDLLRVCPRATLFDLVVAENGAVLYDPQHREETLLAPPICARFAERLRERGISPLEVGRLLVATTDPHRLAVLEVIRELGLELQMVFNRHAVMEATHEQDPGRY